MDVVCGRCKAEYEFDDALIAERGTTVRCTNCGLQFKVFPPAGQRAPDLWRLFDPSDLDAPTAEFASLSRLQKAIARGEVDKHFLLSRGNAAPRPLLDIVELQPLLRQPRSEPPPQSNRKSGGTADADDASKERRPDRTVLGIAMRADPAVRGATLSDDDVNADPSDDLDEEVVPGSEPPEPEYDQSGGSRSVTSAPPSSDRGSEARRRIRSALSAPLTTRSATGLPESNRGKSVLPRTSLRSTLATARSSPRSPQPRSNDEQPSTPREKLESEPGSTPGSGRRDAPLPPMVADHEPPEDIEEMGPSSNDVPPASSTRGKTPSSRRRQSRALRSQDEASFVATEKAPEPSSAVTVPRPPEPSISDSGDSYPGAFTPTPTGMRAYGSAESPPVSAKAGVPSERRARSAWLIAAVAAGGVTFFALANRPKDEKKATDPAENSATEDQVDQASQVAVRQQLEEYEVQWLMSLIASEAPTPTRPVSELPQRVGDARLGHSWEMVNALRLAGRFNQARSLSQTLSIEDGTLSLALLDLAEAPEAPPWPLIIKRLIEAAALDKEPFVAKSALVYSLAKSGDLARARSELERLQASSTSNGPAATGSRAPLAEPLSLWLDALDPTDPGKTNGSVGTPQLPAQAAAGQLDEPIATDNSQTAATEKQESDTKRADVTSDASNDTAEQPPTDQDKTESKPQKVRPEVEAKVTRADMLWRGGNRDAALKLYREVVAEIGTTHFLGQRSAARIRRAEKEQAGAQ